MNQLDHIILEKDMSSCSFSTAYHNFASYHKSIVLRLASSNAKYRKEFIEGKHFNIEKHLKSNKEGENSSKMRNKFPNKANSEKLSPNDHVSSDRFKSTEDQDINDKATSQGNERNISCSIDLILLRLKNPPRKNLCFSNVVATCLINIPVLRKFLQGKTAVLENQRTISAELSELARHLSTDSKSTKRLRTIVMTKCLMSGQKNRNFNNNMQFDCVEFMQALFEHFWEEQSWDENLDEHVQSVITLTSMLF
jgi:hypothetical protein